MATFIDFKDFTISISIEDQKKHIHDWLLSNWNIPSSFDLNSFLNDLLKISKALFENNFCEYIFSDIHAFSKKRKEILNSKYSNSFINENYSTIPNDFFIDYDAILQSNDIIINLHSNHKKNTRKTLAFNIDYISLLLKFFSEKYNLLTQLTPLNYENINSMEVSSDLSHVDTKQVVDSFNGFILKRNSSFEFPFKLNIHSVAYDHFEQSRTPQYVLINAVIEEFKGILEHNNSHQLLTELSLIDYSSDINYEYTGSIADLYSPNIAIKKLINISNSSTINLIPKSLNEELLQDRVTAIQKHSQLTEEEKINNRNKALNDILKSLQRSKNNFDKNTDYSLNQNDNYVNDFNNLLKEIF